MSKEDTNIDEIMQKVEEATELLDNEGSNAIREVYAKAIIIAHYTTFLAIVWKSFDLSGQIPLLAKVSLIFFGLGALMSVLRFYANVMVDSMEYITVYRKLITIKEKYGEQIKAHDPEDYACLSAFTGMMEWALKMGNNEEEIPAIVYTLIYMFVGSIAQFFSFLLLVFGFLFLAISAF